MTEISQYDKIAARISNLDDFPMTDVSDTSQSVNGTTRRATGGQVLADVYSAQGRLTLESGVPVSTTDQTAKTTLYYTPCVGDCIALSDANGLFENFTFTELSISLAGKTASKPHDVFIYNNSGTPALELLEWTSTVARATALAYTNGILLKSGDKTRRYLGTICTTSTTGQCEDSNQNRLVWNYYNRVLRRLLKTDSTSHSYTTGTYRQWNGAVANQISFVSGVQEDAINMTILGVNTGAALGRIGVLIDGTTSTDAEFTTLSASSHSLSVSRVYAPQLGFHYVAAIEYGVASLTESSYILMGTLPF
jgi:hypothetical protein